MEIHKSGASTAGTESNIQSPSPDASLIDGLRGPLPLDRYRDWKLEDELREAQRLVNNIKSQRSTHAPIDEQQSPERSARPQAPSKELKLGGGSTLAWGLSGLGLAGLVCGCALLVWSIVVQREELWTIGLPIALVSQVVLACGVMLRREGSDEATGAGQAEQSATYVQVESSAGGMQPSGLSVHFANSLASSRSLNTDHLRREIEAVVERQRAA